MTYKCIGKKLLAVAGCSAVLTAVANTVYVSAEFGNDESGDGSPVNPVKTIQAGVDKLSGGSSRLWISNGVYKLDTPITFQDNAAHNSCIVSSISGNPADVVIDGQNKVRCIHCLGYSTQFHGITVENGYSEDGYASGFYLPREFFVVSNCVVRNCRAESSSGDVSGGGLFSRKLTSIEDTLFVGCTAEATADSKYARGGGFMKGYTYNESGEKLTTIRNVVVSNCTVRAKTQSMPCGGGVYINRADVDGLAVFNCTAESCDASPTVASAGYGGGIYKKTNFTNTFENVLITNCTAGVSGAGFYGDGDASGMLHVSNCSFVDNTSRVLPAGSAGYGGGAYFKGAGYEVTHCRFSNNRIVTSSNDSRGGGVHFSTSSSLLDCIVESNAIVSSDLSTGVGKGGGLYASARVTISNCVIAANSAWQNGAFHLYGCDGALMTDVFVISNTASERYSIGQVQSSGDKDPVVIRNSYFTGNGGEKFEQNHLSSFSSYTTGANAPVMLEYCTFVSNCVDSTVTYVVLPNTDSPKKEVSAATVSNLFVKGCVFSENSGKYVFPNSMNTVTNITCTYADAFRAEWWTSVAKLMNYNKSMMPGGTVPFADLATDRRIKPGTPFIDKGDIEDWMGSGRKTGPLDMGDGTYTIVASGKYGVSVQRNNAVPRISGDGPDYGCFELWKPKGFVIQFW